MTLSQFRPKNKPTPPLGVIWLNISKTSQWPPCLFLSRRMSLQIFSLTISHHLPLDLPSFTLQLLLSLAGFHRLARVNS